MSRAVLWIQIRIGSDPHHFAGSGSESTWKLGSRASERSTTLIKRHCSYSLKEIYFKKVKLRYIFLASGLLLHKDSFL
jgi:hypothetical protein